jgi:hypothetical protein
MSDCWNGSVWHSARGPVGRQFGRCNRRRPRSFRCRHTLGNQGQQALHLKARRQDQRRRVQGATVRACDKTRFSAATLLPRLTLRIISGMARGWESKSVEAQPADTAESSSGPSLAGPLVRWISSTVFRGCSCLGNASCTSLRPFKIPGTATCSGTPSPNWIARFKLWNPNDRSGSPLWETPRPEVEFRPPR